MSIYEKLIWNRDHSDALHEYERYDRLAAQLAAGFISEQEAAQLAGFNG